MTSTHHLIEAEKERFATGEITLEEFEERVEQILSGVKPPPPKPTPPPTPPPPPPRTNPHRIVDYKERLIELSVANKRHWEEAAFMPHFALSATNASDIQFVGSPLPPRRTVTIYGPNGEEL